ncbi:MAG: XdhC family protein [Phycisphaerales bacterium]|nr:XdhC family protein [Phycisphaerales bacterium]
MKPNAPDPAESFRDDALSRVLRTARDVLRSGGTCTFGVITEARGSTPQVAGAMILVRDDGTFVGTVGGGIVEATLLRDAETVRAAKTGCSITYDLTHVRGESIGAVCGGFMDIALIPLDARDDGLLSQFERICDDRHAGRASTLELPLRDAAGMSVELSIGGPPALIIIGAGHCGHALAELCATLDFDVTIVDDRAELAAPERFPPNIAVHAGDPAAFLSEVAIDASTAIAVVTRGHQQDYEALRAALATPASYIGLIGSRRKSGMIFRDLRADGFSEDTLATVRTPIGIDIGAETVREIAVSIAAELIRHRRRSRDVLVTVHQPATAPQPSRS